MAEQQSYATFNKALSIGLDSLAEAQRLISVNPEISRVHAQIADAAARLAEAAK